MSRRKSKKSPPIDAKQVVRNPVAANPLLGKSQPHGKTRKADRRASKVSLRKMPFERVTGAVPKVSPVIGSNGILLMTLLVTLLTILPMTLPMSLLVFLRLALARIRLSAAVPANPQPRAA